MSRAQVADFNARIKRISDPRNDHYVDVETGMKIPKRLGQNVILKQAGRIKKPGIVTMVVGLLIGALCLMAARYIRVGVLVMPDQGDVTLGMELGFAAALALVLGGLLGQVGFRVFVAQFAGAAVMAVAMHNLIWAFPNEFALVYPQSYVDQVRATTQPKSLIIRGETFTI